METLEFFTDNYAFLSPLLLPWLQKLCHDSAEEQLKSSFETELETPIQLISCTNFTYQYIKTTIIPRLIHYIERGGNKGSSELYLRSKLALHYSRYVQELEIKKRQQLMQNDDKLNEKRPSQQATAERKLLNALLNNENNENKELSQDQLNNIVLNARYFELLLIDILNDLCAAYNIFNILCIEKMAIIQYIRTLIYECEKNIKQDKTQINVNSYSGLICCNLLSILNHKHAAECVCSSETKNVSNFKQFADVIAKNNAQSPQPKDDKANMEIDPQQKTNDQSEDDSDLTANDGDDYDEDCLLVSGYSKQIASEHDILNLIAFYYSTPLLLKIKDETKPSIKPILYSPVYDDWNSLMMNIQKQFGVTDVERLRTLFYGSVESTAKQEINEQNWANVPLDMKKIFVVYEYKWYVHADDDSEKVFYQRISDGFLQWERPSEPVVPHWIAVRDERNGDLLYKNLDNALTTATKPKEFFDPNEKWVARIDDASGKYYYQNIETNTTQWEAPPCFALNKR